MDHPARQKTENDVKAVKFASGQNMSKSGAMEKKRVHREIILPGFVAIKNKHYKDPC